MRREELRPILPSLFFELIYLDVLSSVYFRGGHAKVEHRPPGPASVRSSMAGGGVTFADNLFSGHIAAPGHAAGIDGYCVLGWSPDRRLAARRRVGLNFAVPRSRRYVV